MVRAPKKAIAYKCSNILMVDHYNVIAKKLRRMLAKFLMLLLGAKFALANLRKTFGMQRSPLRWACVSWKMNRRIQASLELCGELARTH